MRFEPKTREQFNSERLVPKNTICDAEVTKAEEKVSKSGNDMIAISLKVYHGDHSLLLNDWLVAGNQKLLNFCDSAGLSDAYMAGEVDADLVLHRSVKVKIGIDPAKDGFAERNKVVDYVVTKPEKPQAAAPSRPKLQGVPAGQTAAAQAAQKLGDDVPF